MIEGVIIEEVMRLCKVMLIYKKVQWYEANMRSDLIDIKDDAAGYGYNLLNGMQLFTSPQSLCGLCSEPELFHRN